MSTNRRERFREIIRHLDGSGDPAAALSSGFYLERPDGLAETLTKSLEIRPHGTHLIVGSIGSGKTTVLHRIREQLAQDTLTALFDLADVDDVWSWSLAEEFHHRAAGIAVTFLFDGADRMEPLHFRDMISEALPSLTSMGCGLVCVGPPSLQADIPSFENDWFDTSNACGAVDPHSPAGRKFLHSVLETRAGDCFTADALDLLTRRSGGLIRDLLLLSRQAVENAYIQGDETIGVLHVEAASLRFGQALLRGASEGDITFLSLLDPGHPPRPGSDELRRLLLHRWLIPLGGTPARYILHPAIEPFLDKAA